MARLPTSQFFGRPRPCRKLPAGTETMTANSAGMELSKPISAFAAPRRTAYAALKAAAAWTTADQNASADRYQAFRAFTSARPGRRRSSADALIANIPP